MRFELPFLDLLRRHTYRSWIHVTYSINGKGFQLRENTSHVIRGWAGSHFSLSGRIDPLYPPIINVPLQNMTIHYCYAWMLGSARNMR